MLGGRQARGRGCPHHALGQHAQQCRSHLKPSLKLEVEQWCCGRLQGACQRRACKAVGWRQEQQWQEEVLLAAAAQAAAAHVLHLRALSSNADAARLSRHLLRA